MKKIKKQQPDKGKRLKAHPASEKSPQQLPPVFSLEYLMYNRKYCLSNCGKEEKALFADRLFILSQLTWAEILNTRRGGLGFEKIPAHQIKAMTHPDVSSESYLSFRCLGKAPMVGKRVGRIFYILWLDRDFSLYKH